jgi:hypothetical protein
LEIQGAILKNNNKGGRVTLYKYKTYYKTNQECETRRLDPVAYDCNPGNQEAKGGGS